ncbi:MAG: lactate utilization protein [Thermodesulfobacteriota bacterium]
MDQPINHYWQLRLNDLKSELEANNFEVFLAENRQAANQVVLEDIIPKLNVKTVSFGGSMTVVATGVYEALKKRTDLTVIDTYDKKVAPEEGLKRRRQALAADLFVVGTNAVTETGMLVNLDMLGNRVGALTFGPKNVIVLVGRNKIVDDIEEAMFRIKNYAAPINAARLDKKTPCVKTGYCDDCKSPDRICNTWTITEKSYPKGRIKVVLINEDLGF